MTSADKQASNRRLAWIFALIALVFGLGFMARIYIFGY